MIDDQELKLARIKKDLKQLIAVLKDVNRRIDARRAKQAA